MDNDDIIRKIKFNEHGLVPAIAQDHLTGQVLMMAWMNAASIVETLETGQVTYWSRSRGALWRKGETSGHLQTLREFYLDCDGDTILMKVHQIGPACHTGQKTCFFNKLKQV